MRQQSGYLYIKRSDRSNRRRDIPHNTTYSKQKNPYLENHVCLDIIWCRFLLEVAICSWEKLCMTWISGQKLMSSFPLLFPRRQQLCLSKVFNFLCQLFSCLVTGFFSGRFTNFVGNQSSSLSLDKNGLCLLGRFSSVHQLLTLFFLLFPYRLLSLWGSQFHPHPNALEEG